jgi:hypothetical protein
MSRFREKYYQTINENEVLEIKKVDSLINYMIFKDSPNNFSLKQF